MFATKLASILVIITVISSQRSQCNASATNPNGAIHARVTANGFNYINQVLRRQIDAEVNRLNIPAISGDRNRVQHELKNIRIERVAAGPSSIESTTSGLRWKLSFNEIRVRVDWWFRYKKGRWLRISDSGHGTATLRNVRFDITLHPRVQNGKLAIIPRSTVPSNCASVGDLSVRIGGSKWAWLYNILIGALKGRLRDKIPPKICEAAGKAVEKWSREVFPNIETSDEVEIFNEKFLLDYGLIQPQFQNGLANIRFLGEVFPVPQSFNSFPFGPSSMPATARSKHVYLVISDFVFNTFLYSTMKKGIFSQTFNANDDDMIKDLVENVCKKVPSEAGVGDLSSACSDLQVSFGLVEDPKMLFSKANGITLQINKATLHIKTTAGGQTKDLLKIQIDIAVSATPRLSADGRRIHFTFAAPSVTFDLIEPSVDQDAQSQVQRLVSMLAARHGRRALNKFGEKGVKLPNVKGKIDIKDRELVVEDGALVIAANLDIKF